MRRWIDNGIPLVKVSVNLSRMHLGDERLAERIMEIIDKYDIPHEYIEIELTETTTDVNFKELKKIVSSLHELGLECIVEGVESIQQVEILKGCNCFRAQGYFFDKPLPVNIFENRLCDSEKYIPEE